jgi:hypothetical protein
MVLPLWFATLQAARTEKLCEMRVRLRRSYDDRQRAELRTLRERDRAQAAEAERDALLAGMAWMGALEGAPRYSHCRGR